jgi:hypothetical protein
VLISPHAIFEEWLAAYVLHASLSKSFAQRISKPALEKPISMPPAPENNETAVYDRFFTLC